MVWVISSLQVRVMVWAISPLQASGYGMAISSPLHVSGYGMGYLTHCRLGLWYGLSSPLQVSGYGMGYHHPSLQARVMVWAYHHH